MKRNLLFVFIFLIHASLLSAKGNNEAVFIKNQSTEIRQIDQRKLDDWSDHKDFQYDSEVVTYDIPFLTLLNGYFNKLLSLEYGGFFYILLVAVLSLTVVVLVILIILRFSGTPLQGLFFKSKKSVLKFQEGERIDAVDFEELLVLSVQEKDWKEALRFSYLSLLQSLSENEIIQWRIEKTNTEYVKEVESATFGLEFLQLTNLYERVWYGHFPFSRENFEDSLSDFEGIKQSIKVKDNE